MTWPTMAREPVSRLRVRTKAIVLVVDHVTQKPPPLPPPMRLQRLLGPDAVDLDWHTTLTPGGAVVFDGHMDVDGTTTAEHYRLIVESDAAQRPDRPGGYAFTVGANPARWPVRVAVRLLPGPAYAYQLRVPVVRGRVVELARGSPPVADAEVTASEPGVVVPMELVTRCATDERGSFSLGLPEYQPTSSIRIRASAPGFVDSAWRPVKAEDLDRPVRLTIRR
jgi:hypothetical protein